MVREILENEIEKWTGGQYVYIKNEYRNREEIREFLDDMNYLIKLWDEPKSHYKKLLNDLKKLGIKVNEEISIGILKCVIEYLYEVGAIDGSNKNYLYEINEKIIQKMIENTTNKFINFELNDNYRILGEIFNIKTENGWMWFGDALISLFKNNAVAHFYTTNYDGILDVLLMRQNSEKRYLEDGFDIFKVGRVQTKDGNIWRAYEFTGFYKYLTICNGYKSDEMEYKKIKNACKKILKNRYLIAHLHGSYKFVLTTSGKIYKITKSENNHPTGYLPVIIYNSPVLKENIINQFKVLRCYFKAFKFSLRECSKFVIWGNSLKTDPHIVEAICKNFDNKEKPLYIIDINPDPVIKQLQNGCKKYECEEFKNIKTLKDLGFDSPPKTKEELLELFRKIITD